MNCATTNGGTKRKKILELSIPPATANLEKYPVPHYNKIIEELAEYATFRLKTRPPLKGGIKSITGEPPVLLSPGNAEPLIGCMEIQFNTPGWRLACPGGKKTGNAQ
jgi:hypothetical protein